MSTIRDNMDGCVEHYRCDTALYLLSILSQAFNIIIYRDTSAPVHDIDVVDGLNATYKSFIFHLMATVQLSGSERFDTKIIVHTATQNSDVSLAQ